MYIVYEPVYSGLFNDPSSWRHSRWSSNRSRDHFRFSHSTRIWHRSSQQATEYSYAVPIMQSFLTNLYLQVIHFITLSQFSASEELYSTIIIFTYSRLLWLITWHFLHTCKWLLELRLYRFLKRLLLILNVFITICIRSNTLHTSLLFPNHAHFSPLLIALHAFPKSSIYPSLANL